jgi:hypothetical protein
VRLRPIREREGGVILLLTLFVILITYALVAQLTIGTAVSYQVAKNSADRIRMRRAATDVSAEELLRLLADDLPSAVAEEASAAADTLGNGLGGDPAAGEEGAEEEEDDGSNSDSRNDDWWRPTRFPIGEMEVHGFVQDENSKFNILLVFHPDEDERVQARERFVRILDFLREDFEDDLDTREAERILDEFVKWVEGDQRGLEYPLPRRHSTVLLSQLAAQAQLTSNGAPEDGAPEGEAAPQQDVRELFLPYSLEELMLLESVTEKLFYDEVRVRSRIAPGIESVFTIYTTVDFDPPSSEELGTSASTGTASDLSDVSDPNAQDPNAGEEEGEESELAEPIGGLDDILEAAEALGILINLNTTPPAVLKGLLPPAQFPTYFVDQILEYRNEVDEEKLAEQDGGNREFEAVELERAIFREDEKIPMRYFRNLEDLVEIDGWEERLEPEQREAFEALIGVQSDIFSVYLWCRIPAEDWEQKDHYEEPPGAVLRLKAVVWRREGEDGAKFVFLEPWHEVERTRWRIPDFQNELGAYFPPRY